MDGVVIGVASLALVLLVLFPLHRRCRLIKANPSKAMAQTGATLSSPSAADEDRLSAIKSPVSNMRTIGGRMDSDADTIVNSSPAPEVGLGYPKGLAYNLIVSSGHRFYVRGDIVLIFFGQI